MTIFKMAAVRHLGILLPPRHRQKQLAYKVEDNAFGLGKEKRRTPAERDHSE